MMIVSDDTKLLKSKLAQSFRVSYKKVQGVHKVDLKLNKISKTNLTEKNSLKYAQKVSKICSKVVQ